MPTDDAIKAQRKFGQGVCRTSDCRRHFGSESLHVLRLDVQTGTSSFSSDLPYRALLSQASDLTTNRFEGGV